MSVRLLESQRAAELRASPFTYDGVGALISGATPDGFTRLSRSRTLERRDFDAAADDLLAWRAQAGAGLNVQASDIPLVEGTVVLLRLGPGPLSVHIPCRVVTVVDEPRRRGFAYGTLAGHPESGEEQ
ncbi:MAG: hypothetical protein JWP82_512, partial [Humibacillus sp.]|nr:hypothetical protein [Humibacillus sp.]